MIERLFDRPRILLPGPLGGVCINAGASLTISLETVLPMQAPYWLGMTAFEELHLQELRFGNESIFAAAGSAPSTFWDAQHPEKLIPIQAKNISPGERILVELYNWSICSVQTTFAVWGTPVDSLAHCMRCGRSHAGANQPGTCSKISPPISGGDLEVIGGGTSLAIDKALREFDPTPDDYWR